MKDIYEQSLMECGEIFDFVFVDQCFEFDCKKNKFVLWNKNCNEIEFAEEIIKKEPFYFIER